MLHRRTFVIGGARSGKSRFAEDLVTQTGKACIYLATAQAFDDEMGDRIANHKASRSDSWRTIEAALDVTPVLRASKPEQVILLDCATLWLSNHLLAESDLDAETQKLLAALQNCPASVVVVSNEVGQGIVPENVLARRFRDAQGSLNQRLAEWSDLAVLVTAGLPLALKGQL